MTETASETGAQISRKALIRSALILLALMLVAGIATRIVPAGRSARLLDDGREVIVFIGMLRAEAF